MAQKVNYAVTQACSLLLWPWQKLPPFWGILFLSLLTSLFVLAVYRAVSSPARVRAAKDQIKAHILAIRLYRDFWRTIVGSFFKSLFYTGKYFALNLLPLLLALPLLFLLFVQMDIRYGMRPFHPGETITLKAHFAKDGGTADAEIGASTHFRPAMNPVHIDALDEIDWKLTAGASGSTAIAVTVNGTTVSKDLRIGNGLPALSNRRLANSGWEHFIYPAEELLESPTPLRAISIRYPARSISLLGLRTHWLVCYLVLTMIFALALKNRFGVEF
jgi:hypothetical protein